MLKPPARTVSEQVARDSVAPNLVGATVVAYGSTMSLTEILDELPRLDRTERRMIIHRLLEFDDLAVDESSDELAVIYEGTRSAETGPRLSLEEARKRLSEATTERRAQDRLS
jgi:predicted transcriptional regulator